MRIVIDDNDVRDLFNDIEDIPAKTMRRAGAYFKSITPIDQGNARRNTRTTGLTIHADYAYAGRLDEGYSRQAPNGMTDPTMDFIEREVNKQVGKL